MTFQRIIANNQERVELGASGIFSEAPLQPVQQAKLHYSTHINEEQKTDGAFGLVLNAADPLITKIELKPASQEKFSCYQKTDARISQASCQSFAQKTTLFQQKTQAPVQTQNDAQVEAQVKGKLSQKQPFQVLPPPSKDPATVVDMLQSLQTIQVIDNDYEVGKESTTKHHSSWEMHARSQSEELADSFPAFIIKPFEESIGIIEADAQTAVKAFDAEEEMEAQPIVLKQPSPSKFKPSSPLSQSSLKRESIPQDNNNMIKIRLAGQTSQEQTRQDIPIPFQLAETRRFQEAGRQRNPRQMKQARPVPIPVQPENYKEIEGHLKVNTVRDFSEDFDFEEDSGTFSMKEQNSFFERNKQKDFVFAPTINKFVKRSGNLSEIELISELHQPQQTQKQIAALLPAEGQATEQKTPGPIQTLPLSGFESKVQVSEKTQAQPTQQKNFASQAANFLRLVEPTTYAKQNWVQTSAQNVPQDLQLSLLNETQVWIQTAVRSPRSSETQVQACGSNNQINQEASYYSKKAFSEQRSEVSNRLNSQAEQTREELVPLDQNKANRLLKQVSPKPKQIQQQFKAIEPDQSEQLAKQKFQSTFEASLQVFHHNSNQIGEKQCFETQSPKLLTEPLQSASLLEQLKIETSQNLRTSDSYVKSEKEEAKLPKPLQAKQNTTQIISLQPDRVSTGKEIQVEEIHVAEPDQNSEAKSRGLDDDEVQLIESPVKDSPYLETHIEPSNSFKNYFKSNLRKQELLLQTSTSRNIAFQNEFNTPQQQQQNNAKAVTQEQTRRLYITRKSNPQIQSNRQRQSNPQENSVLLDPRSAFSSQAGRSQLNVSSNGGDQNASSNAGDEPYHEVTNGNIKLSKEYIKARKNMLKKGLVDLTGFDVRKSQRILKVVNIIGGRATGREGSLSATRVSQIRQRQYKSKGEKVIFRHTGSREQLLRSSELSLGFTQVFTPEIPDNQNGRKSATSYNDQMMFNSKAKKNLMLLSSQTQKNQAATSANTFYPSSDTANLNKLLDRLNQEDNQSDNPFDAAINQKPPETDQPDAERKLYIPEQIKKHRNSIRPQSLNKTTDIFKRANSAFNSSDATSPQPALMNLSLTNGEQTFDDAINQQRDPFLIEKMEQQHKISMHRKNSASRASIESQKRSQREESIRERRQQRKQMAMQRQAQIAQRNQNSIHKPFIPKPTIASEFMSADNNHRWPASSMSKAKEQSNNLTVQGSFGLSNMFGNKRPSAQQHPQEASSRSKASFNFHNCKNIQKSEDDDKDSHFSEEW